MTAYVPHRGHAPILIAVAALATMALPLGLLLIAVPIGGGPAGPTSAGALSDIPGEYLSLYRAAALRYGLRGDGWSVLAAVGKIECDHGRSRAMGCHPGESNSAGARGPAQFLPATWAVYGVDADADGVRDIYAAADAVYGMAHYLRASGAPADWRRALLTYNHSRSYVERVLRQAAEYRASASPATAPAVGGPWLAALPGFPGERCDRRIVPDVLALARAYRIRVTDCFGGAPHKLAGEHPLGLAIDAVPHDGDWSRTLALARAFGWEPSCATHGCPGRGFFRVILYNGFPGHGDPSHTSRPHLHLSWDHAVASPFTQAAWVRVLVSSDGVRP